MLDIKKVYIDTRFKTSDSNSDTDFYVELPRALNIPDKCVCYIDDIVIPVSWTMIDERNSKLYFDYRIGVEEAAAIVLIPYGNYTGPSFATALETAMNVILNPFETPVSVSYDYLNHYITILLTDGRSMQTGELEVVLIANKDIPNTPASSIHSVNSCLRLSESKSIFHNLPVIFHLDLHTTRNLYLTSSSLGSYNTISNFGNDVIIKKIPVRYNYNEMLFDGSESGYDYLDVSKRMLRRIDFRLQDSYGNIINLNNNHWSFSLIFQLRD
jgi:hypothetical protein